MDKKRRQFTKGAITLGIVAPLLGNMTSCGTKANKDDSLITPLKILILGGTSFLGPHQISYALSRGHQISTFTRGKTKPTVHAELFEQVEQLIGDRANNLTTLEGRSWDVVIDNSGHNVEWTKKSADLLKDQVGTYMYTSSTGVYYPYLGIDIKEDTPLLEVEPENIEDEELKMEYWYGVMKTNSEKAARETFGIDRTIVVRPTYMFGPGDKTDRFIHWPVRLPRGGEILVPGKANDPVQYIDVRDVAEWMIRLAENKLTETFNAVGPAEGETIRTFAVKAKDAFDIESTLINVDDYQFLMEQKVPYLIPWIMPTENNYGSARANNEKAKVSGLTFRSLKQSLRDTHDWWYSDALPDERRAEFEQKTDSFLLREKKFLKHGKEDRRSIPLRKYFHLLASSILSFLHPR